MERNAYLEKLNQAFHTSPVVAILGPRQTGKTTLAQGICSPPLALYLPERPLFWLCRYTLQSRFNCLGNILPIAGFSKLRWQ